MFFLCADFLFATKSFAQERLKFAEQKFRFRAEKKAAASPAPLLKQELAVPLNYLLHRYASARGSKIYSLIF